MNEIGCYLKLLRETRGYTQRGLSKLTGVSNSTISRIEGRTKRPDPETLKKLSLGLGADYNVLMQKAGYLYETKDLYETGKTGSGNGGEKYVMDTSASDIFEAVKKRNMDHISDSKLKEWIIKPESVEYLKLAKKLSEIQIDPQYVLDEFVYRIFRRKKAPGRPAGDKDKS
ncbi:MAG: helix-turn-helix transcriptional regulator [Eubacteriales bacterium]|nr:helix-turn-helix transcriptional regulator [Eubacteriales bacterium]